ncbi:uncharacterized protein LOC135500144 [Lineus longissimus]|uniref:uncharacterized protein LOC135500144 n=1 Tax=Lineus longissimus TaxID=88925 RepID=UPI00315DEC4B
MALRKLPDAFGIVEARKGYFPFLFNTPANQEYTGPYPALEYYDPGGMQPKDREAFLRWYENHKDGHFDLQEELLSYCISDVEVLRRACGKFRNLFLTVTGNGKLEAGIDPFKTCLTIASACNLVYRSNFLQEEAIAIIPLQGYAPKDKCSVKAIKWLKWVSHSRGVAIQHARNGGEKSIGRLKVDGFAGNTVFEFYGCLFHGCERCFRFRQLVSPFVDMTMYELKMRTVEREEELAKRGFQLETIWECEYERQLKTNPEMAEYISKLDIVDPLEPRDAFYGGRTNAARLYYEAGVGESVKYVDVCSPYPWVNKYCKYPTGHPEILTDNLSTDVSKYEGLMKCVVLPPRYLFHPVLPYRSNGKLLFPLCSTCADTLQQAECNHSAEERALHGTWVSVELHKAIEMGYVVVAVHEVWHFKKTSTTLFKEYINTFLQLKQQASDWPRGCASEEARQEYLRNYEEHEGIALDPKAIEHNPGMRSLAKTMLNGFWGKLGQRSNLGQTIYVKDPDVLINLLLDPASRISDVYFVNNEMVRVQYTTMDAFVEPLKTANIAIACYTTAHARLKLFSILEPLGDRVLYYDTDSCIYIHREDQWNPECGRYLGDLTDELDGDSINIFVSGGPKNYAYKTVQGFGSVQKLYNAVKHRGITISNVKKWLKQEVQGPGPQLDDLIT